jgi:hypothetical protein
MRTIDAHALLKAYEDAMRELILAANTETISLEMVSLLCGAKLIIEAPTVVDSWISVKDHLPKEHPSIFAPFYGTDRWKSAMWRNESDRVLVTIRFPDGTRTVDKGKLQDGIWKTGVSPVLPQEVTHWAVWPEPSKEDGNG